MQDDLNSDWDLAFDICRDNWIRCISRQARNKDILLAPCSRATASRSSGRRSAGGAPLLWCCSKHSISHVSETSTSQSSMTGTPSRTAGLSPRTILCLWTRTTENCTMRGCALEVAFLFFHGRRCGIIIIRNIVINLACLPFSKRNKERTKLVLSQLFCDEMTRGEKDGKRRYAKKNLRGRFVLSRTRMLVVTS